MFNLPAAPIVSIATVMMLPLLGVIGYAAAATAQVLFNANYDASTGTLPDVACPPWTITDTASPEDPTVAGGILTISTSAFAENISFQQLSPFMSIPDTLVVEFRSKFISGSSNNAARSPMGVAITTAPSVGTIFFIESGAIFLTSGELVRGPQAVVPTGDDFHTYRIEVVGSSVKVSYDGLQKLTGSTYNSANDHGPTTRILWGEGSGGAFGQSEWQYFRHNGGAIPCSTPIFSSRYDASTGLLPEQSCPPWSLINQAASVNPYLQSGKLIFYTGTNQTRLYYVQQDVLMPDPLVVEFRAKLDFGTSSNPARGPISIVITTAPEEGIPFFISDGEIFVAQGHNPDGSLIKGPSAAVATIDDFHTYRIDVSSSGAVSAYYDGFLKLRSHTYGNDLLDHGTRTRVGFGEGSVAASGQSEWEYVQHNAGVPPEAPPSPFSLVAPPDGDTVSTWRVPIDWINSVDPDCVGPVSYYVQVDTLNTFVSAVEYGPRSASQDTLVVEFVPGRTYYWRVRAGDAHGDTAWASPGYHRFVTYAGSYPTAVEVDRPPARAFVARLRGPNPFDNATEIEFTLPVRAPVQVRVLDVSGRLIRTVGDENLGAGTHRAGWDGRDDRGVRAAAGVYFLRVRAGDSKAAVKCLLLR